MANAVSHDQNFKNLILDYPRESLAFFAAPEAPSPEDEVRIVPARQEQLQERLGGRYRELDVLLLVEWTDGRRDAVLFALEEESDGTRFSPHRMAHYCLDLAEMYDTDRVVAVAIFLRGGSAARTSLALGTERRRYLTFECIACRLNEMPAERWRDSGNVVARVNLPNMRSPPRPRDEVYSEAVSGLMALEPDPDKQAKYLEFIDIYAALTDNEYERYRRRHPEESNAMAGVIQRARDEAMQRGIERGMRRGRVEGERAVLERQLRRRFGRLPPATAERLAGASAADLEAWAENVLDAETVGDVFR